MFPLSLQNNMKIIPTLRNINLKFLKNKPLQCPNCTAGSLLWDELYPPKTHKQKSQAAVTQRVTTFGDRAFKNN